VDCIVRWGKLKAGDAVVTGTTGGKIRILNGVDGKKMDEALPSTPVRIIGLKSLPRAGDDLFCVSSEAVAKDIASRKALHHADEYARGARRVSLDAVPEPELQVTGGAARLASTQKRVRERFDKKNGVEPAEEKEEGGATAAPLAIRAPVVVKADADGTLLAVEEALAAVAVESSHDIEVDVVGVGVGPVTSSDVLLATEAGAAIFAFGVRTNDRSVLSMAEREKVQIRHHTVIYSLLDDARKILAGHLPSVEVETVVGRATVQAVFDMNVNGSKRGRMVEMVAGCRVNYGSLFLEKDGKGTASNYRVIRNGEVVCEAATAMSIRKFKDEVKEVNQGDECGVGLRGYAEFEEGDVIECFSKELKKMFV